MIDDLHIYRNGVVFVVAPVDIFCSEGGEGRCCQGHQCCCVSKTGAAFR